MRLFVAVEATDAWRKEAAAVQRALSEALPRDMAAGLRPVEPRLMHLTVRFLGEVEFEQVAALQEALERHVREVEVPLSLGRAGTFGTPERTSVVWLGVDGDVDALRGVAAQVETAAREGLGASSERRLNQPHLTLARVRRLATEAERKAIAEAVAGLPAPAPHPTTARSVVLFRSWLSTRGPFYEVLSRHPSDGAEAAGS